jgi:hypothetical protein
MSARGWTPAAAKAKQDWKVRGAAFIAAGQMEGMGFP